MREGFEEGMGWRGGMERPVDWVRTEKTTAKDKPVRMLEERMLALRTGNKGA